VEGVRLEQEAAIEADDARAEDDGASCALSCGDSGAWPK
jgi:hypothetical protein